MGLDIKFLVLPICRLNKAQDAYIDGDCITGILGNKNWTPAHPERICEQFLNCRNAEDVLRFTRHYGPINEDYLGQTPRPKPGESFRFRIASWLHHQYDCKVLWGSPPDVVGFVDDVRTGDHFRIQPGETIQFQFSDVSRLIKFLMLLIPRDKQRVCENPDCRKFFFAEKRSQVYCGAKACKHFGSLKNKRDCWDRNSSKYLASRREKQQREER